MPLGQSAYDVHGCGGDPDGYEAASGSCAKADAGAGPRVTDPHPIQISAATIAGKKFFGIEDYAAIQSLWRSAPGRSLTASSKMENSLPVARSLRLVTARDADYGER